MQLSLRRNLSRLPKQFPVGTTYVVEGRGGKDGHLSVFSRYVVLPDGQRINLGAGGQAQKQESAGSTTARARRSRGRRSTAPGGAAPRGKRRAGDPKKISTNPGTPRRNGR